MIYRRKKIMLNGKSVERARYIMSVHLGRELLATEHVHHIDGDALNDTIENLKLMDSIEHLKYHRSIEKVPPTFYKREISDNPNEAWCHRCNKFLDKSKFYKSKPHWNGVQSRCKSCSKEREAIRKSLRFSAREVEVVDEHLCPADS